MRVRSGDLAVGVEGVRGVGRGLGEHVEGKGREGGLNINVEMRGGQGPKYGRGG